MEMTFAELVLKASCDSDGKLGFCVRLGYKRAAKLKKIEIMTTEID
jgi:hypothetical protein